MGVNELFKQASHSCISSFILGRHNLSVTTGCKFFVTDYKIQIANDWANIERESYDDCEPSSPDLIILSWSLSISLLTANASLNGAGHLFKTRFDQSSEWDWFAAVRRKEKRSYKKWKRIGKLESEIEGWLSYLKHLETDDASNADEKDNLG